MRAASLLVSGRMSRNPLRKGQNTPKPLLLSLMFISLVHAGSCVFGVNSGALQVLSAYWRGINNAQLQPAIWFKDISTFEASYTVTPLHSKLSMIGIASRS